MNKVTAFLFIILGVLGEIFVSVYFILVRALQIVYERLTGKRPMGLSLRSAEEGKGPVIWVHGLNMAPFTFRYYQRYLKNRGWGPFYDFRLGPLKWNVEQNVDLLEKSLKEISQRHGRVHVIAHSIGGFICRVILNREGGDQRISTLITLATPHSGTPMARLSFTPPGKDMLPLSPIVTKYNNPKVVLPSNVTYRFIWSQLDPIVPYPWGGSKHIAHLNENFEFIPYLGHSSILTSRRVIKRIDAILEASLTTETELG